MKTALAILALFACSTAYAGEPAVTVGDIKPQHIRRPELSRAAERYGEPKISVDGIKPTRRPELYGEPKVTVGNEKPVRRPELSCWFLWLRSF